MKPEKLHKKLLANWIDLNRGARENCHDEMVMAETQKDADGN